MDIQALISTLEKLPGAVTRKVETERDAVKAWAREEIDAAVSALKGAVTTVEQPIADLDDRIKAALKTQLGGFDLTTLEAEIEKLLGTGADTVTGATGDVGSDSISAAADTKKADLSQVFRGSSTVAGASDSVSGSTFASSLSGGSSESSVSSGFADFSHHADDLVTGSTGNDTIVGSAAAIGAADTSTTTLGAAGSQDLGTKPEPKPAEAPQKMDPATSGKQAADAARQAGDDPVPAAAKAAYAAAVELGVDPVKAATDAAAAEGAGSVEAARAAENADAAVKEGQAPATA